MGFIDRLKEIFPSTRTETIGTIVDVNIPESLYIKELALYCAVSIIANAVSQCEIKVYKAGKNVQDNDWYSLNIKPNKNESASEFWHKVIERMLRAGPEKGAFVFEQNGNLYCADNYNIDVKRPFLGNIYSGVIVDGFQMDRKFMADQCMIFRLENIQANRMIAGMYEEYGKVISSAMESYKGTNGVSYRLNIAGLQAGDPSFAKEWEDVLKNQVRRFTDGESRVWINYTGRTLEEFDKKTAAKNSDDVVKKIEEIFKITGKAYKIPESLMLGNITNMNDVVKSFLTFAVDPITDMIGKVLTGAYGIWDWMQGNYYKVDTSGVNHIDIFDMANNIDKLISSAFASVDEVRERTGLDAINEEWSRKHLLTKNYEFTENVLKKGGMEGDKSEDDV